MADSSIWFSEPVGEAVRLVSEKSLVFLVYIYDESEKTKKLDIAFNDAQLLSTMKQKTIAYRMNKDSQEAKMFGQIYPISQTPIVYFILQGTIKDFSMDESNSEDIIQKINSVYPQNIASNLPQHSGEVKGKAKEGLPQQEKSKPQITPKEQFKRSVDKQRTPEVRPPKPKEKQIQAEPQSQPTKQNLFCNLNIRQLDGSNLKHQFSVSDTLNSVSNWIDQVRTDGDMPYKLFAQFPNRNFDIGDEQRSLLELKLCPSATLIMKPIKNVVSAYNQNSKGWFSYLYSATDTVYNSVSQLGNSVTSYLASPSTLPEPGQRLGGPSQNNIHTLDRNDTNKKQTYNGNSVNHE